MFSRSSLFQRNFEYRGLYVTVDVLFGLMFGLAWGYGAVWLNLGPIQIAIGR